MRNFLLKQPRNLQFYTSNLIYHIIGFVFIEFIFTGTISNWGLLSAALLADYRYFKDYL